MQINYHTRKLVNFSYNTRKDILYKLTIDVCGSAMRKRIDLSFKEKIDDIAIICKYKKEIIGWSCIFSNKVMLFINPRYRNKGIGTELLNRSERYLKRNKYKVVRVSSWSECALDFYNDKGYIYNKENAGYFALEKKL